MAHHLSEIPKPKSSRGFYHSDGSPCNSITQSYEARLRGRWQTFLGTSVISVPPTDRYKSGFVVAVMIEEEGEMCGDSAGSESAKGPYLNDVYTEGGG